MFQESKSKQGGQLYTASFRDLSRVPRSVTRAYQHEFLVDELPRLAADTNSNAVLREQMRAYEDITGRTAPYGMRVALGYRGEEGISDFTGIDPQIYETHLDWIGARGLTKIGQITKAHQGNSFSSNLFPLYGAPDWEEYVERTWARFGARSVSIVNYSVPFRTGIRLMMASYFNGPATDVASRFEFDIVNMPFAIVWMKHFGVIDDATMRHWLRLLANLTPAKLFLIREIIGAQRYHASLVAERTGISKRNLENHIYQLSDVLDEKVPQARNTSGNGSIIVDIANHYGFLSFAGRPFFGPSKAE